MRSLLLLIVAFLLPTAALAQSDPIDRVTTSTGVPRSTTPVAVVDQNGKQVGTTTNPLPAMTTPSSAASAAITPIASSTALESSRVLCASACNAYDARVNSTSAAVWVMAFNSTAAPANGAVTPADWWQVSTNTTASVNFAGGQTPTRFTAGLVLVCSTTGPFTLTLSATCTFSGRVK